MLCSYEHVPGGSGLPAELHTGPLEHARPEPRDGVVHAAACPLRHSPVDNQLWWRLLTILVPALRARWWSLQCTLHSGSPLVRADEDQIGCDVGEDGVAEAARQHGGAWLAGGAVGGGLTDRAGNTTVRQAELTAVTRSAFPAATTVALHCTVRTAASKHQPLSHHQFSLYFCWFCLLAQARSQASWSGGVLENVDLF